MRHGRNARNDNCFNCHDPEGLDTLKTRDGRKLAITDSTLLCANCHGPTYRDWEAGIHGRTSGHWDRQLGSITRQDCVSCHDPHAPAFPFLKPAPGPHPLHPAAPTSHEKTRKS
jgi:mono/diheme cytochrome c family protein